MGKQTIGQRLAQDPAIRDILIEMEQSSRESEKRRAEADPKANALSRVFERLRYRYFKTPAGDLKWYWSTTRNVAGYFLSWREVRLENGGWMRDQHIAHKRRSAAKALAQRCYEAHKARG